jgi:hypothetical protein
VIPPAGPPLERPSLGQIGYEAYGDARGWVAVSGQRMPFWHEVGEPIREAWEVAASAIRRDLAHPRNDTMPMAPPAFDQDERITEVQCPAPPGRAPR